MGRGIPIVLSAPSGAGKSTLVRGLRSRLDGIGFSVSHTTRAPRAGEKAGEDYHFVDRPTFEALVARGGFAEWAEVHGNLYGTSLEELFRRLDEGVDVLLDIDVQGARQIAEKVEGAVRVFVLPPAPEELRGRLRKRASDPEDVVERRLANARAEMEQARGYDYLVVNDDVERAVGELCAIVRAERCRTKRRLEELDRVLGSSAR